MRLLFLLIWRNNFTLVFILLQLLCIYLLVQNNKFQNASVLNSTNAVAANVMEAVSYVREYIYLRENNENLARENARLRTLVYEGGSEADSSVITLTDTLKNQQYTFLQAKVINNSVNNRNNYLTLDKGSVHGVKPEMGVISSNGVIGIVKQVSRNYCTVMSLLHKDSRVSAMIDRNKFFGSMVWDGDDPTVATLKEIDKTVPVQKGDTIVTTAFSALFPSGIMLGTVLESQISSGSNFHQIRVKLSTRFDNLTYVYVVGNLRKDEQRGIESKNLQDEQ